MGPVSWKERPACSFWERLSSQAPFLPSLHAVVRHCGSWSYGSHVGTVQRAHTRDGRARVEGAQEPDGIIDWLRLVPHHLPPGCLRSKRLCLANHCWLDTLLLVAESIPPEAHSSVPGNPWARPTWRPTADRTYVQSGAGQPCHAQPGHLGRSLRLPTLGLCFPFGIGEHPPCTPQLRLLQARLRGFVS